MTDIMSMMTDIWQSSYGVIVLLLVLTALWRAGAFRRLLAIVEEMLASNWQLALLGATAVALSLASGYTTFDGLRNFTSAPLLSALVAFGIQGVMLIVAWLIGESFATGMSQQIPRGKAFSAREAVLAMALGVALVGLVFYWMLSRYEAIGFARSAGTVRTFHADWQRFADVALYFLMALALLGLVAFNLGRGGDILQPYVQGVRLIAKNAILWVMFLASMSASVFFSFDSHFNAIFPAEQRKRAAEMRTLNQVAFLVADIGERARKVQIGEIERLFESDGWKAYDAHLARLALAARGAQAEIEAFFVSKMEERQRGIGEQQERIAGAERSRTALLRKRDELEAELRRIEPSVGALEAELAKAQAAYDETRQAIAAKRIDASAEDGGVEGTLKPGKGPAWRQRMAELDELQRRLALADEPRLKEAQRQRDLASARIVGLKREIATIVGEVAKYQGQIATTEHRIKSAQAVDGDADLGRIDPSRALPAFERARAAFRQQPDSERLAALERQCAGLVGALSAAPVTKEKARGIDCDPKQAAEAAARLLALNAGLAAFHAGCAGGSKLPQTGGTDELLSFGRKCLQDSGLVSKDSADLGVRLQAIEMNRDDKAHRFVVTWNAVLDGNRLAYLALVLAVGVDALVFTAGLFGAAAARSPLSDLPSPKARSAEQLEAVVEAALLPNVFDKARLALGAMAPVRIDPVTARARGDGFTHEATLGSLDPETAVHVRGVLNAGATIGAVRAGRDGGHYLVRSELFEFLSGVVRRKLRSDPDEAKRGLELQELETRMIEALLPDVAEAADAVLRHLRPTEGRSGFTSELDMRELEPYHARPVRSVLTAGSSLQVVQRGEEPDRYYLHADLYRTLARIRARHLSSAGPARSQRYSGGQLEKQPATLPSAVAEPAALAAVESPSQSGATPAPARQLLLADGRPRGGLSHVPDEDDQRRHFGEVLLNEVVSDASTVAAELQRHAGAHRDVRAVLQRLEREGKRRLDRAARALARQHADDGQALQLLDETRREIAEVVPALMLLPELNLLEDLIGEAEKSADQELLKRLHTLRDDIERMDRGDGSAWRYIARQLKQLT